ncbi:MAG: hypothetical protein HRT66_10410 [Flavobacteriaceae bacterium]|nr:hypothetical protein [Flavobacteriaceae bacterium]
MKIIASTVVIILISITSFSQEKSKETKKEKIQIEYSFKLLDGTKMFTMAQSNENYLSSYRIVNNILLDNIENQLLYDAFMILIPGFWAYAYSHERGHMSVLNHLGIGSLNQPLPNEYFAAYVNGVTDETLKGIKENNNKYYIRLHTAGIESDYGLAKRINDLMFFKEEKLIVLEYEYLFRKIMTIFYISNSLYPSLSVDLEEEANELDRDIVGHDVWGAIRNWHNPDMEFQRYNGWNDLNSEEKKYGKKIAWRSFLNFIDPMLYGNISYTTKKGNLWNANINYALSPFGDFLEQNFWYSSGDKLKIKAYIREFQNKDNTFFGGGASIYKYPISEKVKITLGTDVWSQPKNLSFIESESEFGYNIYTQIRYKFVDTGDKYIKAISLITDFYYKTSGFVPEYDSLDDDFGFRLGFSFSR